MSTIPIESKLYMEGDRLMLQWTGCRAPLTPEGGSFAVEANCGGAVDVTSHIERAVERAMRGSLCGGPAGERLGNVNYGTYGGPAGPRPDNT